MERAVPILPSRDLDETLAFYRRLGFANLGAAPDEWDYLIVGRGDAVLHFVATPDLDPRLTAGMCYLYVDDVDRLHEEWRASGVDWDPDAAVRRLVAPMDTGYGMRELAMVDPSGNLVRAGSALPDDAA